LPAKAKQYPIQPKIAAIGTTSEFLDGSTRGGAQVFPAMVDQKNFA